MGAATQRCSPMDGDEVLPAAIDEDTNIGNVTCLPIVGNTIGMGYLVAMATCVIVQLVHLCIVFIYIDVYCMLHILNYVHAIDDD